MEVLTLVGLRRVICGPVLSIGRPDALRVHRSASLLPLALDEVLYCVDMLARHLSLLKVWATAVGVVVSDADYM